MTRDKNIIFGFRFLRACFTFACLAIATSRSPAQATYGEVALDAGGWVSGLVQHPTGRLYGYGDIFGVYRSDDFGANWKFLQGSITENVIFVQGLAVSPVDVNRVAFSGASSLWNSIDGGDTWTKRLGDFNGASMTRGSKPIAYHPTQPDELWTAAPRTSLLGSLWRSIDHGANWTAVGGTTFVNERAITIHLFPSAPNEIWVGTGPVSGLSTTGGLWCSVDSGGTWRKVWNNNGAATRYYGAPQVSCIARNTNRVSLIATNTGVLQVTATNWGDPATYVVTQRTFSDQNIPNVTVLADGTFWTTEIGDQTWAPKVSSDGSTWTDRQIAHTAGYIPEWSSAEQITSANRVYGRDMLVQDVANPSRWLLTGGAAAHLSEDNGLTWRYQPGGMAGIASYRVHFDEVDRGRFYLSTSDRGIFIGNDGGVSGKTFTSSRRTYNELHTFHETMVSTDGQTLVAAGVNQGISRTVMIRSTDAGATWAKFTPAGLPVNYEGVTRSVMSRDNPNDFLVLLGFATTANQPNSPGLYRTTDGGANFVKVGGTSFDGVDTGMRYHPEYSFLERDGINPDIRYLSLRSSNVAAASGLWRSTDGGTSWVWRGIPFGGGTVYGLAVDPTIEGRLWGASNLGLRRSDNGGGTWTTNLSSFTSATSVSAHDGRIAVLGRRTGDTFNKIYSSLDDGATWQEMTNAANRMIWAQTVTVDPWRPGQIWVAGSRSYQLTNPPATLTPLLTGTISGSASASGNPAGNTFDGNTATAFAPAANGGFAQIDLGASTSARLSMIRFFPRAGFEARMNGGRFEGSANGTTWKTLASVTALPLPGWQTHVTGDPGFYRYLRYIHPTGLADVAEVEFRGTVAAVPTLLNQPLTLSGLVGKHLSFPLAHSGYPAPTFAITSGSLPAGLALNAKTGAISGTATAIGAGSITVQATNFKGSTSASIALDIAFGPRLAANAPAMHYQLTNTTGNAPITLTNTGNAPLSWSVSIPSGSGWLSSISPASSVAAGSNLAAGATITLNATVNTAGIANAQTRTVNLNFASNDPVGPSQSVAFKLTVGTAPTAPVIGSGQTATGPRSGTISYAMQATNSPLSWTLASGSLPAGVVLNPVTGVVSGSPASEGIFTAGITATNHGGTSPVQTFQLTITPPAPGANYDFNVSQVHFEETFNETEGWRWALTTGVGGSGGVGTDSITRAAVLPTSMITFTTSGQSVEMGIAFKARVGGTNAGGDSLRLGLSRVNTPLLTSSTGYLAASINKAPSTSTQSVLATEARNSGSTTGTSDTTVLTLVDNNWYAVDTTITYNGSNNFTVVSELYDLGASGTSPPTLLDTYSVVRTGLTGMVNQPLYAGFQGYSSGTFGSVKAFDNFYARLPQAATGLTTFRITHGLAADGSQDLLTPAGDGVSNLLKYAFNMIGSGTGQATTLAAPNASVLTADGTAGLPLVGTESATGKLQLTYLRRKASASPGINYTALFSDTLASDSWATNPSATESVTSIDATFERVIVTDSVVGPPKRFARVRVASTP